MTPMSIGHASRAKATNQRIDWTQIDDMDHFVHFYESEPCLLESLRGYVATGLRRGEVGLVIATDEHRRALEERLSAEGDVNEARRLGRYIALDAVETLSRFMVNGMPDEERFQAAIGEVLGPACGVGRPVRAFGEMVALLWEQGRRAAAVRLEELWNDLARIHHFTLYCAYPAAGFSDDRQALKDICCLHKHTLPAEHTAA